MLAVILLLGRSNSIPSTSVSRGVLDHSSGIVIAFVTFILAFDVLLKLVVSLDLSFHTCEHLFNIDLAFKVSCVLGHRKLRHLYIIRKENRLLVLLLVLLALISDLFQITKLGLAALVWGECLHSTGAISVCLKELRVCNLRELLGLSEWVGYLGYRSGGECAVNLIFYILFLLLALPCRQGTSSLNFGDLLCAAHRISRC